MTTYIFEARYNFYRNSVSFSNPFKVTEETDRYYYCSGIGQTYLKKHENDVRIKGDSTCNDNTVIWKAVIFESSIKEVHFEEIKKELLEAIKEFLRVQIEEIETC